MDTTKSAGTDNCQEEELHDILIAISVVAKKLAQKLTNKNDEEDKGD